MEEIFERFSDSPPASRPDRVAGCLVGLGVGDALGAGYEFQNHVEDPEMVGGGIGSWEPGEWTDDTQMAVCIAQNASKGAIDERGVASSFLEWISAHPADVGVQTRGVLGSADGASDLASSAQVYLEAHPNAAGNGSLMRTAPVALSFLSDEDALWSKAESVSALTHPHQETMEACALWCIGIQKAITEHRIDGIVDGLQMLELERREFWSEQLEGIETLTPSDLRPNGYVVTALRAAWWAIVTTPIDEDCHPSAGAKHFSEALKRSVEVGGDTDTVAAIAGSLLGAFWGYSAIPIEWTRRLHGWNPKGGTLNTQDLVRLAHRATREPLDDHAWPFAKTMLNAPLYDRNEDVCEPLEGHDRVWLGNINALKHQPFDFDVVVSLCRVGTEDVPSGSDQVHVFVTDDSHNAHIDWILRDLAASIERWTEAGDKVLIHCVGAESRTPTTAAAYLAEAEGIAGREGLNRVREQLSWGGKNGSYLVSLERLWPGVA